jgi:hypothetical protein
MRCTKGGENVTLQKGNVLIKEGAYNAKGEPTELQRKFIVEQIAYFLDNGEQRIWVQLKILE